jgi:hypothetical protein
VTERVEVYLFNGTTVGVLTPKGSQPDLADGESVTAWFPIHQAGKSAEGEPVVGMRFFSWREGQAAVVSAYALIQPNTTRLIGTYRIQPGQTVSVDEMVGLGMSPMALRGVSPVAQ